MSRHDQLEAEQLLMTIADHLHEHCGCHAVARGDERCGACELRAQMHGVREQLLAWQAEGRRLGERQGESFDNGATQLARRASHCDECAALSVMAGTLGSRATYSTTSSS